MTRWQLACSGLALYLAACGDSDGGLDPMGKGGAGGARAGAGGKSLGGRSQGGAAGAATGGAARGGAAQGGSVGGSASGGAEQGGSSGGATPKGGSIGMPEGGAAGADAGAGGAAGSSEGGTSSGGAPEAGAGGVSQEGGAGDGGAVSGGAGGIADAGAGGGPGTAPFSCSDLGALPTDVSERVCYDFNLGLLTGLTPQGGTWVASNGAYLGTGPDTVPNCTGPGEQGTLMTPSLVDGLSATDVRVRARLTSIEQADKVIVLRSRDAGNRIELNFRSTFTYDDVTDGGDLIIQELNDCVYVGHADITVPHELGQTLDVVAELRGQQISVSVNGVSVVSTTYDDMSTQAGAVGLAVFRSGITAFDDFVVEVLD